MRTSAKKRIGVLRGGTGENYKSSINEGGDLIAHIFESLSDKFNVLDILIDKDGIWHISGVPIRPADLAQRVDMIWDTTHSNTSATLETLAIPKVGVNSFSSLLQKNRSMLEKHMKSIGVNMPKSILLPLYQKDFDGPKNKYAIKKARLVFEKISPPWIVRSFPPDGNMGIHVAKTFTELVHALEDGVAHNGSIPVEELISGKVASIHSLAGFRGEDIYNFPLINRASKFSSDEKEKLSTLARDVYKHLGAEHYLNSNFVLNPSSGIYLTSVSLSPDFKNPHLSKSCELVSTKVHHILEHILESILTKK